jgi:hypothetical protein
MSHYAYGIHFYYRIEDAAAMHGRGPVYVPPAPVVAIINSGSLPAALVVHYSFVLLPH